MDPTLEEASCLRTPAHRLRALADRSADHRRAVACNPAAPPELLLALASHGELGPLLASNPGVPATLLWRLAARHPREVLANPIFALLMLERPDLGEAPDDALIGLLSTGELGPEWFFRVEEHARQASRWGLLRWLAESPATPVEILENWGDDPRLQPALLKNPRTPDELRWRLAASTAPYTQICFARSPQATPGWLTVMAGVREEWLRKEVAGHPRTPPEVLKKLARDPSHAVQSAALRNPSLPDALELFEEVGQATGEALLRALAARDGKRASRDESRGRELGRGATISRLKIAARTLRSPTALAALAASRCGEVRLRVACNWHTAPATLALLASDPRPEVRQAAARHRHTPPEARERLERDPVAAIRKTAARARAAAGG